MISVSKGSSVVLLIVLSVILVAFSGGQPVIEQQPLTIQTVDLPWLPDFEQYIQKSMQSEHIPGLALAIVDHQGILAAKGFGVRNFETGAPVTVDTLFHIGSTHKSMTAMLIASLVDDGLFEWDTPLATLAPTFSFSDNQATQSVTMRHLLSMQAGIPAAAEDKLDYDAPAEDVLTVASEAWLFARPGEKFEYSNLSASVAGYLGVLAAGYDEQGLYAGYAKLFEEKVLIPIGMTAATLSVHEAMADPNYSYSYSLSLFGKVRLSETYDIEGDPLAPAGSLKANVVEMGNYVSTHLNQGVAPNGNRVVSTENLAETWIPYMENYAMGWDVFTYQGIDIISHTGAYDDYASVIGFIPEMDLGFVILLNSFEAGYDLVEAIPYVLTDLLLEY